MELDNIDGQSEVLRMDKKVRKGVNIVTGTQLLNMKETEIPHLWYPFIPSVGLTALVGSSDVGKSSFLRQLVTAIALKDTEFLCNKLNINHGRALYFSTEDSAIATSIGLKRQLGEDIKAEDLKNLGFILNSYKAHKLISAALKENKYDLIVIDAFADVFIGQINDISSVRGFLNQFDRLANEHECAILFLHHVGKRTETLSPSKNNIIGSQGFEAKMRTVMELRTNEHSNQRTLGFLKGNYLLEERKRELLLLEFNENQQFSYIKTNGVDNNLASQRVFAPEQKEAIMEELRILRASGISIDRAREELLTKLDKVPSKGTLSNWLKEDDLQVENDAEDVQPVETIKE